MTVWDVDLWMRTVPRIDPHSPRAAHYIRAYCVFDKIRHAKQDGTFDALTAQAPVPLEQWWRRFNWY